MSKKIFILAILLTISFTPDSYTKAAATTTAPVSGSILDSLIPWKKNCTYSSLTAGQGGLYEPFSDITSNFPGGQALMTKGKNSTDCVNVKTDGVENLLKLLFTTGINVIIVLTVISISVAGIQYMTEQATGKVAGGAKKRLTNSLVALALGLLSYTILYTINKQLVNFTFNPASIDKDGSIARGIADAEAGRAAGTFSSSLLGIEPIVISGQGAIKSPTGWINPYTNQPCTPQGGLPQTTIPKAIPVAEPTAFLNRVPLLASVYQLVAIDNGYVPTGGAYNPNNPWTGTQGTPNYLNPTNTANPGAGQTTQTTGSDPCIQQSNIVSAAAGGFNGTGVPQAPGSNIQVSFTNINNPTQTNASADGNLSVNGVSYNFRSGGGGNGYLPAGIYTVTNGYLRNDPASMTVDGFGYSFDLSDSYDPRTSAQRTLLRIHPDGGGPGTAGCIGIQGSRAVQEQFYNNLQALLAANGGKYTLRVGI